MQQRIVARLTEGARSASCSTSSTNPTGTQAMPAHVRRRHALSRADRFGEIRRSWPGRAPSHCLRPVAGRIRRRPACARSRREGAGRDMTGRGDAESFGPYAFALVAGGSGGRRGAIRAARRASRRPADEPSRAARGLHARHRVRLDSGADRVHQPARRRSDAPPRRRRLHDPAARDPLAHRPSP